MTHWGDGRPARRGAGRKRATGETPVAPVYIGGVLRPTHLRILKDLLRVNSGRSTFLRFAYWLRPVNTEHAESRRHGDFEKRQLKLARVTIFNQRNALMTPAKNASRLRDTREEAVFRSGLRRSAFLIFNWFYIVLQLEAELRRNRKTASLRLIRTKVRSANRTQAGRKTIVA